MDYETRRALEGAQAASEAKLERDLADLELLRNIRAHPDIARAIAEVAHQRSGWRSGRDERFAELLDDVIKLLGGEP
jgi:hypothetical protein